MKVVIENISKSRINISPIPNSFHFLMQQTCEMPKVKDCSEGSEWMK